MDRQLLMHLCDEYALGLLEGSERAELETLLKTPEGAEARALLRDSEALVSHLALLAPPAQPPAALRQKVLGNLFSASGAATAPVVEIRQAQAVDRAAAARPKPSTSGRSWVMGWAIAAGLAVVSLYSYFALRSVRSELESVRGSLAQARAEADRSRKVLAVIFSRDARFVKLSTAEQAPTFRAFWGGSSGLVLAGANVPAPSNGRTFQLWVVPKSGNPVSAGVFAPGLNGQVLMIAETTARIEDAAALAISDEPTGGSAQPTTKPVFVGNVGD